MKRSRFADRQIAFALQQTPALLQQKTPRVESKC